MKKVLLLLLLCICFSIAFSSCASKSDEQWPTGVELISADSNDGAYRMTLYLCTPNDEKFIRGELTALSSGETKNILWDNYSSDVAIEWTDDSTVKVNGRSLNVTTDVYDCRETQ